MKSGTFVIAIIEVIAILFHSLPLPCQCNKNKDLIERVLANSSRSLRPVSGRNTKLVISCELYLYQLNDLNVVNQVVDLTVWIVLGWKNELVSWNPDDYNDIDRVDFTEESDVWLPDMVFYNQIDGAPLFRDLMAPFRIDNQGVMFFSQSKRASFLCPLDASYFPFDEHMCNLKLGPWTYDVTKVDVNEKKVSQVFMLPNTVWDVVSVDSRRIVEYYGEGFGNYSAIIYSIHVRRRSQFYVANVIIPSVAISYLNVFNFMIPCESGEKIGYGVTIFLAQTVNLMIISELMPSGGQSVPILGQYLLASIIYIVFSLLATIIIITIYLSPFPENVLKPGVVKFILTKLTPYFGPKFKPKRPKTSTGNSPDRQRGGMDETPLTNGHAQRDVSGGGNANSTTFSDTPQTDYQSLLSKREQVTIACETLNRFCGAFAFFTLTLITLVYLILLVNPVQSNVRNDSLNF